MAIIDTSIRFTDDGPDSMSFGEWDGFWVTDWLAGTRDTVPPPSADPTLEFAHENPDAWDYIELPSDLNGLQAWMLLEFSTGLADVSTNNVALARHGNHNQKDHAGKGGRVPRQRREVSLSNEDAARLHARLQEPDGGFTVNPRTGKDVTSGYAVAAFPERSKEIPLADTSPGDIQDYVTENADLLAQDGNMLGGWHDPDTGHVWLDVSTVTNNRAKAIELAQKTNQIAIFDLSSFESIPTGGTGKAV